MKKTIALYAGFLISAVFAFAQEETVILKDGSIYKGFVSSQKFGKDNDFEITYSEYEKVFRISEIKSEEKLIVQEDSLSLGWRKWAQANGKFTHRGSSRILNLVKLNISGQGAGMYYVMERGTEFVKCHSVSDGIQVVKASEIYCLQKNIGNPLLLNSLDEIVSTDKCTYRGVIVEQYPGIQVKVCDRDDRRIHVVNYHEITSIAKEVSNTDYSLFASSPYLEQVIVNGKTSGNGVITGTGFSDDAKLVLQTDDSTSEFDYKSVSGILKKVNPNYVPEYDIILANGEIRINRDSTIRFVEMEEVKEYAYNTDLNSKGILETFRLNREKCNDIFPVKYPDVTIEVSAEDVTDNAVFVFQANEQTVSENRKSPEQHFLTYSYSDWYKSNIKVNTKVSKNGTAKYSFTLPSEGFWFVVFKNKGVLCIDYSKNETLKVSEESVPEITEPRRNYFNVGFINTKLSGDNLTNIRSNFGVSLNIGRTFFLHKKPVAKILRFGIDATWLDLSYTNYKFKHITFDGVDRYHYHQGDIAVQCGPSIIISPLEKLDIHAYFRYAPTFSFINAGNVFYGNYASLFVGGASVSYGLIGLGIEARFGSCRYNTFTKEVEGNELFSSSLKNSGFRAYITFRF